MYRSSTEAEYQAMAQRIFEVLWLHSILTELGLEEAAPSFLFCDNKSAIMLSFYSLLHEGTKHIEVDIYFIRVIREKDRIGIVSPSFISSSKQLAEITGN